ncbi:MAG: caspase family protein [Gallionellaceae bacterium]
MQIAKAILQLLLHLTLLCSLNLAHAGESPSDPMLRIDSSEHTANAGLVITLVLKDSPAMKAGLQLGDIVLEVDSVPVSDVVKFISIVQKTPPNGKLQLKLFRKDQALLVDVIPIRESDVSPPRIGAGLSNRSAELPSGPLLRIDPGEHTAVIRCIATDAAGRYVVTASEDKTARVWSVEDGRLLNTLRIPIGNGDEGKLYAVALSPDGLTVALGGTTQAGDRGISIFLFDRASGRLLRRLTGLPQTINYLAFSPDGQSLAVTLGDNGLRLFSVADGRLLASDTDYGAESYSVHFSPSEPSLSNTHLPVRLVTTSYDGYLRLYRFDGSQLTLLAKRSAPGGKELISARFSPDGRRIAVGFENSSAVNVLKADDLSLDFSPDTTGVNASLGHVAWSHDGETLYAAGKASSMNSTIEYLYIRSWEKRGAGVAKDAPVTRNTINGLSSLPGNKLAFGSQEPSWGVLNTKGTRQLFHASVVADFRGLLNGFSLSADGTKVRFAYEFKGKSAAVFDMANRSFVSTDTADFISPRITASGLNVTDWYNTTIPKLNGTLLKLQPYERSRSLALLPDGSGFALGAAWYLRLFDRNGNPRWQQSSPDIAWAINVSADGRWVVAAYGDGTIRWHRASDGVEQIAFFPHPDKKRWIMWTPEGYYDASPGGEDLIGWHLNQGKDKEARFIPSGQLYDVFFRPDIVQAKFRGDDISSLITLTAEQALKMPPPVLSFTKVPSTTKINTEKVCYKAVATGGGIGEIRLFQNGKLIKSDGFYRESVAKVDSSMKLASNDSATVTRALKLTKTAQKAEPPMVSNSKGNEFTECQDIETIPGDNEISVAAFNANNTVQSKLETSHFTSERKAEAPHLYVLGIGIDKYTASENNLSYAVKDATDFSGMIQERVKGLFNAANIHIEGLSDAAATKAGIQQAISAITAKVKPWDSFILFVASHGYLQDNQYYIVTSDFDGAIDTSKMISSNEIVGMSKNIKSLSQLLIFDTCHAGGVDNIIGGLYDARMSVMAKKMGLHIYASAGGTQTALDGYQGNGLFTHSLLKSMKANTTDTNRDSEVSVAELGESAKQETMTISKQLGFPQSPNIINFGKDNALFRVR